MSRVHDALRRAERSNEGAGRLSPPDAPPPAATPAVSAPAPTAQSPAWVAEPISPAPAAAAAVVAPEQSLAGLLEQVEEVPFQPSAGSLLVDVNQPYEAPMEEFRSLRTRLNHIKSLQPLHSVVVTSPSPAEGKSVSAANLALVQSHLAENNTLLADFDFRRPIVHNLFGVQRSPGLTDYLLGKVPLHQAMRTPLKSRSAPMGICTGTAARPKTSWTLASARANSAR